MQGQNLHLLLMLAVFAFSALSWLVGKLREQAAIKKARDEMRRARDEQLRTGRETAAPAQTGAAARSSELNELRELAAKRQRQLEQMREMQRQAAQSQRTAARVPARDPRQSGGPGGYGGGVPGVPLPAPKPARGKAGVEPGVPKPTKKPDRRVGMGHPGAGGGLQDIRPGQPVQRAKPARAEQTTEPAYDVPAYTEVRRATPRRLVTDAPAPGAGGVTASSTSGRSAPIGLAALLGRVEGARPSAADVRRAVILSEVFGPPVSTRGVGGLGGGATGG